MNSATTNFRTRTGRIAGLCACALALAIPGQRSPTAASAPAAAAPDETSGSKAKLKANGKAIAPASAPQAVKNAIAAANRIDKYKYEYGGGHSGTRGYDCSGAVSYVLGKKGADILDSPMTSGDFAAGGARARATGSPGTATPATCSWSSPAFASTPRCPTTASPGPGWSKDVGAGFANVSKKAARHKGGL